MTRAAAVSCGVFAESIALIPGSDSRAVAVSDSPPFAGGCHAAEALAC